MGPLSRGHVNEIYFSCGVKWRQKLEPAGGLHFRRKLPRKLPQRRGADLLHRLVFAGHRSRYNVS
jgi:hypothetical protein